MSKSNRSWWSRFGELLIWLAVSVGTALIMIALSERLLPANF